jgi:hypothetical protein
MMLPRLAWQYGMNSAMAAPVATPVSSKSPINEVSKRLRPITLKQVMSVIKINNKPARMANNLASV